MERTKRIGPTLVKQPTPLLPCFRPHDRIMLRCSNREHVAVFWNDVPVAGEYRRPLLFQQVRGVSAEPPHPANLIIEFFRSGRISIGEIKGSNNDASNLCFDVATVRVVGIARKANATQFWCVAPRKYCYTVEPFLAVPNGSISSSLDVTNRKRFVGAFELLQADNVRLLAIKPFNETGKARSNSIEIVSCKFHEAPLSGRRSTRKARVTLLGYAVDTASILVIASITGPDQSDGLVLSRVGWQQHDRQ